MNRLQFFPIVCPPDCPHYVAWDLSIDDFVHVCTELNKQTDEPYYKSTWKLPICSLQKSYKGKEQKVNEKKYLVADDNGALARGISLDDALMFMKAYCEKYYMEFIDLNLQEEIREG